MRGLTFRQRQYLILLTLIVLLLAGVIILMLPYSREFVLDYYIEQLDTVADMRSFQVQEWVNQGEQVAVMVSAQCKACRYFVLPSGMAVGQSEFESQRAVLTTIADAFTAVKTVSLLHPITGRVLISTDPTLESRERGNEDYFIEGQHDLYISPVAFSLGREAPLLVVSAPVWGQSDSAAQRGIDTTGDGQLLAVVAVEMDLDDLQRQIASRAGLGESGTAYLVDSYGFYVTLPWYLQDSPLHGIARSAGVERVLQGEDGDGRYADPRGIKVLGVYRWLPDVTMGLLVEHEQQALTHEINQIWVLILGVAASSLVAGYLVTRRMTIWLVRPLEQIIKAARSLQSGDLSYRATCDENTPFEMRDLADAFNDMASSLQQSHQELEERVAQRTAQIDEQSRFLRTVFESVANPLYVIDVETFSVLMANTAAQELRGRNTATTCYALTHGSNLPCNTVKHPCPLYEVKRTHQPTVMEHVHYDDAGIAHYFEVHGYPVFDDFGRIVQMIEYTLDISERKRAENALRDYTNELEERNAELDAFAHTVAHDIKNPLGVVLGYAGFIGTMYHELGEEKIRADLRMIEDSAEKISRIIDELLLLSTLRREQIQRHPLDMPMIMAAVKARLIYVLDEHGADLEFPEEWPQACGYGPWIEEVWANYISNAVKYGGTPAKVTVGADVLPDNRVKYWVRDNGPGLTLEEQALLFTPFTRLNEVRAKGHGLGLSIVKRIIDRLDGEVGVESTPGDGCLFYFILTVNPCEVEG